MSNSVRVIVRDPAANVSLRGVLPYDHGVARAVPAVSRALDILELFVEHPALSAPEIVQRLALPRTTVHELVTTLADRGYLIIEPGAPVRYRLGMRLFQLGGHFAERLDLATEAADAAERTAAACDETVHVGVLDGADVVYIAKKDSTHPVRMVSAVGRRLPAHCTAVGKALLSGLSPEALAARFPADRPLPGMTHRSIRSLSQLRHELAAVREHGVAYDDCESNDAVCCVAAGIRDSTGAIVAAMSISVPTVRWSPARREELTGLVRRGAGQLSRRLGFRDGPPDSDGRVRP
jgi:DNA-binding IclR family transcriptional regulator